MKKLVLKLFIVVACVIMGSPSLAIDESGQQLKEAIDLFNAREYDQSINLMKPLITGPEMANPNAHYYFAKALWKAGDLKRALKHFKKSLEIAPYSWAASSIKKDIAEVEKELQGSGKKKGSPTKGGLVGYTGLQLKGNLVTQVFDNSPAQRARLKRGDIIISVDGVKVDKGNLKDVDKRIRGPVGSTVLLDIKRDGKLYGCKLVRASVDHDHRGISFPEKKSTVSKESQANLNADNPVEISTHRGNDSRFIKLLTTTADTAKIKAKVLSSLALIPGGIKNSAYKSGLRIVITPTMLRAFPEFSNLKPRGYIHGGRYDNCGGMYHDGTIYIAEKAAMYNHPYQLNAFVMHTVLHEFGHAYDDLNQASKNSSYLSVYKQDKDRISNTDLPKYQYFLQGGDAGPSELFAELFAHTFGSNKGIEIYLAHFEKNFPRTTNYVKSLLKK